MFTNFFRKLLEKKLGSKPKSRRHRIHRDQGSNTRAAKTAVPRGPLQLNERPEEPV